MQNPNRDSTTTTTKSPSSSPDHPPPPPPGPTDDVAAAAEGGSAGGGFDAGVSSDVHSQVVDISGGGGGSFALVAGGSSVLAMPAVVAEKRGKKKRKPSQLTDVPAGTPTCPVCGKEFPSWKSAFGHMRAHPKREYRGFFRPPAFSTSSSSPPIHVPVAGQNSGEENINIDEASSNIITSVGFDLNQPMDQREAEAAANKSSETTDNNNEDQKIIGFDLNQLPPSEDKDDKDKHKH